MGEFSHDGVLWTESRPIEGSEVLRTAAADAPAEPGVYLFLGPDDELLYVGKAGSLRTRLRQHAAFDGPTTHLHGRYDRVRRVVWEPTKTERAAAWREADLIFALRPPFNADPGPRSRDPLGTEARPPYIVTSEVQADTMRFELVPEPPADAQAYGCFPHLGKGVMSQLGIACSDGYVALLRLLWAASGNGSQIPRTITRSAPPSFTGPVAPELRKNLHHLLSGSGRRVLTDLLAASATRPEFMQPAFVRDKIAAAGFFNAGPQLVRARRLRHGIKGRLLDAETYRSLVQAEIIDSVGVFSFDSPGVREAP